MLATAGVLLADLRWPPCWCGLHGVTSPGWQTVWGAPGRSAAPAAMKVAMALVRMVMVAADVASLKALAHLRVSKRHCHLLCSWRRLSSWQLSVWCGCTGGDSRRRRGACRCWAHCVCRRRQSSCLQAQHRWRRSHRRRPGAPAVRCAAVQLAGRCAARRPAMRRPGAAAAAAAAVQRPINQQPAHDGRPHHGAARAVAGPDAEARPLRRAVHAAQAARLALRAGKVAAGRHHKTRSGLCGHQSALDAEGGVVQLGW
jgi:hypothetical protein